MTGIWLLELTGFGLSLEQPTVTEQTIRTAAKTRALVFLPQVMKLRVSAMLRIALMRVMVVASCRVAATWDNAQGAAIGENVDSVGGYVRRELVRPWCVGHARGSVRHVAGNFLPKSRWLRASSIETSRHPLGIKSFHSYLNLKNPTLSQTARQGWDNACGFPYCSLQRPIRSLAIWVAPSSTFGIECGASATQVCSFLLVILLYQSRPIGMAELVSVPPKTTFTYVLGSCRRRPELRRYRSGKTWSLREGECLSRRWSNRRSEL